MKGAGGGGGRPAPLQGQARGVADLLSRTGNPDRNIRLPAEEKLSQFASKTGFRSCLLDIGLHRGVPDKIRLAAFVNLKNNLEANSTSLSSHEFKQEVLHLQGRLCALVLGDPGVLPEPLFRMVGTSLRNIAVGPWKSWAALFSSLGKGFTERSNIVRLFRISSVCDEVLEAMYGNPASCSRNQVTLYAGLIAENMVGAWQAIVQNILQITKQVVRNASPDRRRAVKSTRDLCRCASKLSEGLVWTLVKGVAKDGADMISMNNRIGGDSKSSSIELEMDSSSSSSSSSSAFRRYSPSSSSSSSPTKGLSDSNRCKGIQTIVQGFEVLASAINSMGPHHELSSSIINLANKTSALLENAHLLHATLIAPLISKAANTHKNIAMLKISNSENDDMVELRSRSLHFLSELLMGLSDDETYLAQLNAVFNPRTVSKLTHAMVEMYLVPTPNDIQDWDRDPEEYFIARSSQAMGRHLHPRPNAEGFLCILTIRYQDVVLPLLAKMLHHVAQQCGLHRLISPRSPTLADLKRKQQTGSADRQMLLKTGVYHAAGLCAPDLLEHLHPNVTFNGWFRSTLREEIQTSHPLVRPLRERAVWLVGEVSRGEAMSLEIWPEVIDSVCTALSKDSDFAIQMSCVVCLNWLLENQPNSDGTSSSSNSNIGSSDNMTISKDMHSSNGQDNNHSRNPNEQDSSKRRILPQRYTKTMLMLVSGLFKMVLKGTELESQRTILDTLVTVVQRIHPDGHERVVKTVQENFGKLWKNQTLQADLLGVLEAMVLALGPTSRIITGNLIPILRSSLPTNPRAKEWGFVPAQRLLLALAATQAPKVHGDIAKGLLACVERMASASYLNQIKRFQSNDHFLDIKVSLQCVELFSLIAPMSNLSQCIEKVAMALAQVFSLLCSNLYDLDTYLVNQRSAKAFKSLFYSESPWLSSLQSAVSTVETLVQIMSSEQAVKILGPQIMLPIVKFLCTSSAKDMAIKKTGVRKFVKARGLSINVGGGSTSASIAGSKNKSQKQRKQRSPEYDAHIKKVLNLFIRLTAMLVHRWGPSVIEMLQQAGGMGADAVVFDLWLTHYKKMDFEGQKVTLLAMGKLLEARVRLVSTRVMSIAQCCNVAIYKAPKYEKPDTLEHWFIYVRKARNLMDPSVLEEKQVKHYVSRCCEFTLHATAGDRSFRLEVPSMKRIPEKKKDVSRSANNSPTRLHGGRTSSSRIVRHPFAASLSSSSSVPSSSRGSKTP